MRKQLALAAVLSSLLLTACSGDNASDISQSDPVTENAAPESTISESAEPEIPPAENSAEATDDIGESGTTESVASKPDLSDLELIEDLNLYGLCGEKIELSEITSIMYGYDDDFNEDKTKWSSAECDGFAYYTEPNGISYNSIDNADMLDAESWRFNVEVPKQEYKRFEVGDTFGSLTVSDATTTFNTNLAITNFVEPDGTVVEGRELGIPEIFFAGCQVEFSGSAEDMTGYIFICPEDEGYDSRGDIFFIPNNESCVLPVVNYDFSIENGFYSRSYTISHDGEFIYMTDYPNIGAGNIYNTEIDFSGYPLGEPVMVKLSADSFSMRSYVDFVTLVECNITDIEKI